MQAHSQENTIAIDHIDYIHELLDKQDNLQRITVLEAELSRQKALLKNTIIKQRVGHFERLLNQWVKENNMTEKLKNSILKIVKELNTEGEMTKIFFKKLKELLESDAPLLEALGLQLHDQAYSLMLTAQALDKDVDAHDDATSGVSKTKEAIKILESKISKIEDRFEKDYYRLQKTFMSAKQHPATVLSAIETLALNLARFNRHQFV